MNEGRRWTIDVCPNCETLPTVDFNRDSGRFFWYCRACGRTWEGDQLRSLEVVVAAPPVAVPEEAEPTWEEDHEIAELGGESPPGTRPVAVPAPREDELSDYHVGYLNSVRNTLVDALDMLDRLAALSSARSDVPAPREDERFPVECDCKQGPHNICSVCGDDWPDCVCVEGRDGG